MPTIEELRELQAMPLEQKLLITNARIDEWVAKNGGTDSVYVSFSGGKDSTVLLHLVRQKYPDIEAVFCDTGLEYPEIRQFVKSFNNVTILRPKMNFRDVIINFGYPILSKEIAKKIHYARLGSSWAIKYLESDYKSRFSIYRYKDICKMDFLVSSNCCDIMKKAPFHKFEKNGKAPFIATLAEESSLRTQKWIQGGCNTFTGRKSGKPLSFWTEQDVLKYIKINNIKIASVYGNIESVDEQICFDSFDTIFKQKLHCSGCDRTGCVFCGFGAHLEKGETRYQRLHRTHPKLYDFCINGGDYDSNGIWKPNGKGLGFGHVFDELNKLYGEDFIKY